MGQTGTRFLWYNGTATDLGPGFGATAINDAGEIMGSGVLGNGSVYWLNGTLFPLPTEFGNGGDALAVNSAGKIVAYS